MEIRKFTPANAQIGNEKSYQRLAAEEAYADAIERERIEKLTKVRNKIQRKLLVWALANTLNYGLVRAFNNPLLGANGARPEDVKEFKFAPEASTLTHTSTNPTQK